MNLRIIIANLFFMFLTVSWCLADTVNGWVLQSSNCLGYANVAVRFTPPKDSGLPIVVTNTDTTGAFKAELPTKGEYYLGIYFAAKQVYGRVISIASKPLLVILHSSDMPSDQDCRELSQQDIGRPGAITRAGPNTMYILSVDSFGANGKVLILRDDSEGPVVRRTVRLPQPSARTTDLAAGSLSGVDYFFVSETILERGAIQEFSSIDGQLRKTWNFLEPCSGLAIDNDQRALYVVLSNSSIVEKIDLDTGRASQFLEIVSPVQPPIRLGAMALDTKNKKMFISDLEHGILYEVDTAKRSYRQITERVSVVTGLAFSDDKRLLFITDAGHEIYTLNSITLKISHFVRQAVFRRLSGIAMAEDNTMWVVDSDAHSLFHLSSDGKIIKRWP